MPEARAPEVAAQYDDISFTSATMSNGSMSDVAPLRTSGTPANNGMQGHDNPAFLDDSTSTPTTITTTTTKGNGSVRNAHTEEAPNLDDNLPCGWGPLTSTCCNPLRNVKLMLFFLCIAGAIQGLLVNGFVSVVISTIEKRFELASTQTGIIASSYDIASVICLIPVSYFGGMGHKPRWLGAGMFIMGVGSFIFSLPHFLTGLYGYEKSSDLNQCQAQESNATTGQEEMCGIMEGESSEISSYWSWFIAGQLLHGAGATPLYTLGVTYLDENLKAKLTSLYVGIFYGMTIVGPAVGYLLGGMFLDYFCDFDHIDVSTLTITPDSTVWIGAWWLGFLMSGILAIITAIPIFGFPKFMPNSAVLRSQRVSEAYAQSPAVGADAPASNAAQGTNNILRAIKLLLTNPTFMFLNLAGATEGMLLSGFAAFSPKFIEAQFSLTPGWAAMLVGFATIPAGGTGTLLGGYLVKKLALRCAGVLRMVIAITVVAILLMLIFLIQCPILPFAGVNIQYTNISISLEEHDLTDVCNAECSCDSKMYEPVCGSNNIMYFSPCYAGCNVSLINGTEFFHSCVCIEGELPSGWGNATAGKCESTCTLLPVFLALFAVLILVTFMASMPALSATLRCVPEKHKSFALGIQWIIIRCLGTIPAPITFGALIDQSCSLWQSNCEENQGSCYFYNNTNMSYYIMALALVGKVFSLIFFTLALIVYKPPPKTETQGNDTSQHPNYMHSKDSNLNVISDKPLAEGEVASDGSQGYYNPIGDSYNSYM